MTGATSTAPASVCVLRPTQALRSSTLSSGSSLVASRMVRRIARLTVMILSAERMMRSSRLLRLVRGTRLTLRCWLRMLCRLFKRLYCTGDGLGGVVAYRLVVVVVVYRFMTGGDERWKVGLGIRW